MSSAAIATPVAKKGWTLQDIPWVQFNPALVDPESVKVVKAAALVEYNAADYGAYLSNIFHDDPEFQKMIKTWVEEEIQHGEALGRWAGLADPTFDFQESFKRFTDGYHIDVDAQTSVRGSLCGELISRCIVETGTSSYYTALADAMREPVLKQICLSIAGDELRHYKLFYSFLKKYLEKEKMSPFQRLKVSLGRIKESEDDELAYAYFAANSAPMPNGKHVANDNTAAIYDRGQFTAEYAARAYGYYRARHVEKVVTMVFKTCGFETQGWVVRAVAKIAWAGLSVGVARARRRVKLAA